MSIETAAVLQMQTALAAALPATVQRWLPSDSAFAPPQDAAWIQATVLWGQGLLHTMGHAAVGSNLLTGVLSCNVFLALRLPPEGAYAVSDTLRQTFNRVQLPGVLRFDVPSPARSLRLGNIFHQLHVDVPFTILEGL
jgi:hypothetical protein